MTNEIKEIKVNKASKSITFINNGIGFSQLGIADEILDLITNLQEKYDKSLELLANFNMPCEYDEGKISHNYCEEFCGTDDETYKKCWNKYIENILRGDE